MAAQGDIVFAIGADIGPLVAGSRGATSALAGMEKSGRELERQLQRIGQAGVDFQRKINAATGVTKQFAQSARASADAFQAFDRARSQVDSLRASIDPLFAASKRYEGAVEQLDAALEMGAITAREHAQMLDLVGNAYLGANNQAAALAGRVDAAGAGAGAAKTQFQNLGFQIQDFAVQVGSGTSASQALGQQLPQLLSGFGLLGVALGTAAAVTIPLLGMAFGSAGSSGAALKAALDELKATTDLLDGSFDILQLSTDELTAKYGSAAQRVMEFALAQAELNAAQAGSRLEDEIKILDRLITRYLSSTTEGLRFEKVLGRISETFGVTRDQAVDLEAALQAFWLADGFQDQQRELQRIVELLKQYGISLSQLPPEMQSAISEMITLSNETDRARVIMERLAAASQNVSVGVPLFEQGLSGTGLLPPVSTVTPANTGGGGGGGAQDKTKTELERLQEDLMTAEELQLASYQKQQETLQAALDRKLVTLQEYNDLMQSAQKAHQEEMASIDAYRYGDGLQKTGQFLGDMANAFQSGNDKMQRAGRIFGAAEALVNSWRAYTQTLADPSLPFFAKFAAGASVLAAGMSAVAAIKSGSKGGGAAAAPSRSSVSSGGGGGSTGGAAAAPDKVQTVNISMTGDVIGRPGLEELFKLLDKGVKQGYRIGGYNFVG